MKKWKLLLLVAALVVTLLVLTGCSSGGTETKRTLNAKVRYFDGTGEMIELKSYDLTKLGVVKLYTAAGDIIYIGTNNVIILDEEVRP